ncbi:T9SS type A sorting domain-containing protein [candidate division KSB1 bacterium]|nr:T9SS type A sorting domain-containing protein [candidate division KSB1 bacterium]
MIEKRRFILALFTLGFLFEQGFSQDVNKYHGGPYDGFATNISLFTPLGFELPKYNGGPQDGHDVTISASNILLQESVIAVTLVSFYAIVEYNGVTISWITETEPDNAGFNVYRNRKENGEYEKLNFSIISARGNAMSGAEYSYFDHPRDPGSYYYKLQDVDLNGVSHFYGPILVSGVISVEKKGNSIPQEYSLSQNYPNPFNPETTLKYALPKAGFVKLEIFNVTGKLVRNLVSEPKPAGNFWARWDGRDKDGIRVSSGIYLIQFKVGDFIQTNTIILQK